MSAQKFRYYVLLGNMRTGSNLFERTMQSFDGFTCHGELFNPHFVGYPIKESLFDMTVEQREQNPVALIEEMIALDADVLPGFRLFTGHDPRILDHVLQDPRCAKIILTRNPMDSYVSHKIAKATDQWKLGDLHRRRTQKVEFDFDEFQLFLGKRRENADYIHSVLQTTGQAAFHISYDDLSEISVFNGLAKFLGSDEEIKNFGIRGSRQNPEPLSEKVSNYDQLCADVRQLNIFEPEIAPYLEPRHSPSSKRIQVANSMPLMYLPLHESRSDPISGWMASLERDGALPRSGLAGAEVNKWLNSHTDKWVFTCLQHPVERAYDSFCNLLLFKGTKGMNWVRNMMINFYQMDLPDPKLRLGVSTEDLIASGYSLEKHARNFKKFIPFLAGNLRNQTRAPALPAWGSQSVWIDSYARWCQPHMIIPPHRLKECQTWIEQMFELTPLADNPYQVAAHNFPLADVYSTDIERLTRRAYAIDYQKYGILDWPGRP
ncbi:hypothetical protein GCM10007939_17850 [Amylibacter marinus]|uniref:Sulfotransferase family protein n=1 Tax=Amylibacter marinus TaxID=1475483 RepID=A0ABQ5VVN7_9RHOB|nr:hypothetical protein [Amylibacter marinus]GLQ35502.1 hypothetical protein GCM10007939_17850 [Amylibacter marinus]